MKTSSTSVTGRTALRIAILILLTSAPATADAAVIYVFSSINVPGASQSGGQGINDKGEIVGDYEPGQHAFFKDAAGFNRFDFPGSQQTSAEGVNNSGVIAGYYFGRTGPNNHFSGFLKVDETFLTINHPEAFDTVVFGLNDRKQVVGYYAAQSGPTSGFLWDGTDFADVRFPGANSTQAEGINNQGDIVGHYYNADEPHRERAFLYKDGVYLNIDHPMGLDENKAHGINDKGQIVGNYRDAFGVHGYVRSGETFVQIDYPGAIFTSVSGINNKGEIIGSYLTNSGRFAFTATPRHVKPVPECGCAMVSFACGLGLLVGTRRFLTQRTTR